MHADLPRHVHPLRELLPGDPGRRRLLLSRRDAAASGEKRPGDEPSRRRVARAAPARVTIEDRAGARGVRIAVDLDAIRANLVVARRLAGGGRLFATVKADAYGHGAVGVARALTRTDMPAAARADGFAVVTTDEALALREAGIARPILVLQGPLDAADAGRCAAAALWPVIHDLAQYAWYREHGARGTLPAWLKVDTGMGRLGVTPAEAARILREDSAVRWHGVMSHLACADEPGSAHARAQIRAFDALDVPDGLALERSLANSAAVIAWPEARHDWARPGLMLYGCDPRRPATAEEGARAPLALRPAMRVTTSLLSVKTLEAGAGVGYGQSWHCPERMPLGLARAGYGDGLPRVLDTSAAVSIGGADCPIVGRVSMDSIALDLRPAPAASIGDEVELWGGRRPVTALAAAAGTIAYELLTGIRGSRVQSDVPPRAAGDGG